MTIALPQITDAQLTELGWTAGQIKEVRKYLKLRGFERNAHQRGLCRRYSEAQRLVTPVTVEPRFTGGKAPKAKKAKAERVATTKKRWLKSDLKVALSVYLKYTVGDQSAVGNEEARQEAISLLTEARTSSAVNMVFSQIRGLDSYVAQEGLDDTSKTLIDLCHAADAARFPLTGRTL